MSHARESRKVHTAAESTLQQLRRRKLWPALRPVLETLEGRQLLTAPLLGDEQLVNVATTNLQTLADSGSAAARLGDGGWVAGWSSEVQGSGRDVFLRRYDVAGNAVGEPIQANTTTANDQTRISVAALANGGWVAVWQSAGQDGSGAGVYAQRYASDGSVVGGEFAVNQTTAYDQELPSAASLGDGKFVVVWSGRGPGDIAGVFGRRYDAGGNALGDEFRINTWTSNQQTYATVAGLPNGGFLSAWESHGGQDGESAGIYAQRYDASGAAVGSEFRVNTTTSSFQERPAIGVGADGAFIIAWQSNLQDGSQHGIYAQRYAADGTSVGGELRANSYTDGDQIEPSVAVSGSGGFAVAWQGKGSSDPAGVWAQRFDATGTAVGDPLMVNNTTDDAQRYPTVIAAGSGYALAWSGRGTGDTDGVYLRRLGTGPACSGITNVTVNEDAAPTGIDLNQAFADAENADSELSFQVTANTNTALVATSLANGQLTLSYAANASGTAQVTVRATDPGGLFTDSSFTVTVNAVNDAPVAVADAYRLDQNSLLAAEADFGLLVNDSDVDGDTLSAVLVSGPSHGTITLNADGSLQYLPAAGYAGTDSFSYRATDGLLQSATTSVTLTVVQVNSPPVIGSLVDAPDPAMGGAGLILLAQDVSDDTGLSQVAFYRDANGNGVLDLADDQALGADTSGSDGWWVAVSTEGFGQGPHTYFAQATDNQNLKGNVAVAGGTVGPIAVLDDGQPGYTETGNGWSDAAGGRDGEVRTCPAGTGQNTAVWTFEQLPGAYYKVHITWTAGANRASNTPVTIYDGQTVVGTRSVDQQLAPRTFQEDGTWWQYVGTYPIQSGTLRVELSDAANGLVVADAVRIIDPPVAPVVLDPATNAFTAFDVHGRMGNNTLLGDWELGLTGDTSLQPQSQAQRQWPKSTTEPFTFTVNDNWDAVFTVGSGPTATTVQWDYTGSIYEGTRPTPNALKIWANSYVVGAGLDITELQVDYASLQFGVAAEVHVLNTGAGTDFRQIILGNIDFAEGVTITGTVAMHWTGAQPTGSRLQFHIMPVCVADLDADTDNDSVNGQPQRTEAEEAVENKDGTPGKWIAVDGRLADTDTSHRFVPLVVDMASLSSLTNARFKLDFDSSILKLWKHDGDTAREEGDQIVSGHTYTAAELGLGSSGLATLYVQAMKVGAETVTLQATMDGTVPSPSYRAMDTVKFTAINQHVSCIPCLIGMKSSPDGKLAYNQTTVPNGPVISGTADGRDTQANSAPQMLFTGNGMAVVQNDQVRVYYRLAENAYEAADGAKIQGTLAPSEGDYVEVDPQGNAMVFYGQGDLHGKLRRKETVDGQNIQRQYDQGRLTSESQTIGGWTRSSTYEYDTAGRVSLAKVWQTPSGGVAQLVRSVEFAYYGTSENGGPAGMLKTVKVKNAAGATLRTTYYRYYKAGEANGFEYALKYLLDGRAFARAVAALGSEAAVYAATDAQIAPYATDYLRYDAQKRVTQRTSAGAGCSLCAGGVGLGTTSYSYTTSSFADEVNTWKYKSVQTLPDGNQIIVYANYRGQEIARIEKNVASGQEWVSYTRYEANGQAVLRAYPSAVSGYSEGLADLMGYNQGDYTYLRDQAGLIEITEYYAATDAGLDEDTAGGVKGYVHTTYVQRGDQGTPILQSHSDYFARTVGSSTIHPLARSTQYANTDGSGGRTTSYEYIYRPDSLQVYQLTTVQAAVTTGHNGSGTATRTTSVFDIYGRQRWTQDEEGFINYYEYDDRTGALTQSIVDLDDTRLPEAEDLPDGWATPAGGGLHLVTYLEADDQGRTVKQTDPRGNITYTVYNDAAHETRTYGGWDSNRPTGPTTVWREDWDGNYDESLSMSAAPDVSGGRPTGQEAISDVQSLSRSVYNASGQNTESRSYFSFSGISYSTTRDLGSAGTNYYSNSSTFDTKGRQAVSTNAVGTINHSFFDSLDRTTSMWLGTDDVPTNDLNGDGYTDLRDFRWHVAQNGTAPDGTNMVKVSASVYDGGGIGDGNLTLSTSFPNATSGDNRVTGYYYDWRNRMVATKSGVQDSESASDNTHPISFSDFDNLNQVTASYQYDGDNVTIGDGDGDGVPDKPSASLLRAKSTNQYDERGRQWATHTFSVDPSDGSVSANSLSSYTWYNNRGNVLKTLSPGGLVAKIAYDGAGRLKVQYTTDGGGDAAPGASNSWTDAGNVTGDKVLEQVENTLDDNGNVLLTATRQRFHDATGTGELGDPASTTQPKARVSYAASYYDLADRLTDSVDVGTNGGSAYTRPGSVPSRSDTELVTGYHYNDAGMNDIVTDPRGLQTHSEFDMLGRTKRTIEGYVDGTPSDSDDRTTEYTYDGNSNVLTMKALLPGNAFQTTQYIYGVSSADGSDLASNDLLRRIKYPDKSTGSPSNLAADQVSFTYNRLGQLTAKVDQNGTTHAMSYDVLGRMTADAVTLADGNPQHVDSSVLRREFSFNSAGQPFQFTAYDATTGGNVVNQVQRQYNGLGQLAAEYQEHSGAVSTLTSAVVQYAWSEMAGGANHSRQVSMTYPNGRILRYEYSSGLDDSISRLSLLADDSGGSVGTHLEEYSYLGQGTIVKLAHPQTGFDLSYIQRTGESNGDAGDQYTGLDRFGQITDQRWMDSSGNASDRFQYGYDRDGNPLYKNNLLSSANSELYHANGAANGYDPLNRLTDFQRGTLTDADSDGIPDTVTTATRSQSWDLDALGNWDGINTDGTNETRTHNKQNQLTQKGSATLAFDNNGNTVTDENGRTLVYDAWNHLMAYKNGQSTLSAYAYDALNRRILENASAARHLYYTAQWQVIEERVGGVCRVQQVWSPIYVDALLLRDRDSDSNGSLEERLYAQRDANFNITALMGVDGLVKLRVVYDPYGLASFLTSAWASGSDGYQLQYRHQGGRWDGTSGLYYFRNRDLSPNQGRWMEEDPANRSSNSYWYLDSHALSAVDPDGLFPQTLPVTVPVTTTQPTSPVPGSKTSDGRAYIYRRSDGRLLYESAGPKTPWLPGQHADFHKNEAKSFLARALWHQGRLQPGRGAPNEKDSYYYWWTRYDREMQMARYFDALTFGPQQTSVSLIDNQTNEPVIVFFSPPGAYHNMGYEYYILPAHSTTDANRDEGDFVWLGDKQYKVGDGGVGVVRYCDGHKGAREIVDSRGRQRAADSNTNWPTGDLISQMPESK